MRKLAIVLLVSLIVGLFGVRLTAPAVAQSPGSENPCPLTARLNGAAANAVVIPHGGMIRICFYSLSIGLAATTTAQLIWGSGSACGTNPVDASPLLAFGSAVTANNVAITAGNGYGFIDESPTRDVSDLCIAVTGSSPKAYGVNKYGRY